MLAPFRKASFGAVDVEHEVRSDGAVLVRSRIPLGAYPRVLTERLVHWADRQPGHPFIGRRRGGGPFETVSYGQALAQVERLGQGLLDRGLSGERPIAILSENSIEHALLALAALHVGVPFSPISPAYSLRTSDFAKLRHVLGVLKPGLVVVSDGPAFDLAVVSAVPGEVEVVVTGRALESRPCTSFASLGVPATPSVVAAHRAIHPDREAKILFTSGSTGLPKGVVNTHRMLCSNLRQIMQCFPCIAEGPLVLLDWLPWNHTFGGNHNFGLVLENGGTLYIDDGKPTADGIATTVANLREIAPSIYFNVPKGFSELLPYLERDPELRGTFFSRLRLLFYAGAGLAQPVWDGIEKLAIETTGRRVVITSGLGCTESSPSALFAHWEDTWSGLLGVPVPGLELKLSPVGHKWEARYRGPNVTPGYFRQPAETSASFDGEGFYRSGDALLFVAPDDPARGMLFDGRIAEDFKLTTGTWVSFGAVRAALLDACAPLVVDAVLAGVDRDYVGAILFPSLPACRAAAGLGGNVEAEDVVAHDAVRRHVAAGLRVVATGARGTAGRVLRAVFTVAPPSADFGEITDKGSLNQRAVLDRRAALVEALYRDPPPVDVISITEEYRP